MANLHMPEHDGSEIVVESFILGKQLQKAREALNLTPEELAQYLRLHVKVVNAIEADNYEGLPSAYVRGYIRSYARAVGIDSDPLIEVYDKIVRETPVVQPKTSQLTSRARSQDKLVKAITYLVIVVLGTLLVVWWQNRESEILPLDPPLTIGTEPKSELAVPKQSNGAPITESTQRSEIVTHPEIQPSTSDTSSKPDAATPSDTALVPLQAPQQNAVPEATTSETPPVAITETPPVTDPANPPQGTTHTLGLKFIADSWTEISDAKGQRLYYNLAKGGETISVQGESPFSVVIGNVLGTTVFYNGKQVDAIPSSRRGVARFKVDNSGAH